MGVLKAFNLFLLSFSIVSSIPIDINIDSDATAGYIGTSLSLLGNNEITAMDVVMVVPSKPTANSSSFLAWAGIQPSEGNQILRSVISYNPECGSSGNTVLDTPIISPEYIDENSNCQRTNSLAVNITQEIYIQFRKINNIWSLYSTDLATLRTSTISVDLQNIPQKVASLGLRIPDGMSASGDMVFKNWIIQSALPDSNLCQNLLFSRNTICSASQVYEGDLQCALTNCVVKLT